MKNRFTIAIVAMALCLSFGLAIIFTSCDKAVSFDYENDEILGTYTFESEEKNLMYYATCISCKAEDPTYNAPNHFRWSMIIARAPQKNEPATDSNIFAERETIISAVIESPGQYVVNDTNFDFKYYGVNYKYEVDLKDDVLTFCGKEQQITSEKNVIYAFTKTSMTEEEFKQSVRDKYGI